jgi:hypothetical protein
MMTDTIAQAEEEIFTIPPDNIARLEKEIAKLNRRAVKLGFPEMSIEIVRTHMIPHPDYVAMYNQGLIPKNRIPMIEMRDIKIIGDPIKIEGYELMGTLDHYSIPGSVIVRTVPGQTIPTEFHNRDATCDHCGKKRYRVETFVLQNSETGEHVAVGRQCVRDFIGYNVSALARFLERWRTLTGSLTDEDGGWSGGRHVPLFDKAGVLATTFGVIRVNGWKARSSCDEDETPTSVRVCDVFDPPVFSGYNATLYRLEYQEWVAEVQTSYEEDLQTAALAMEWLNEQPDGNEYLHNLKVLNEAVGIPLNMFGYWCSLASGYLRHIDQLAAKKAEDKKRVNEWVGEIKQRQEFVVEINSIRAFEGAYGVVNQHHMLDDAGHTLVWWANTNSGMEKGKTYKIKGSVKKHDEYKDWKQTVLTRVSVLEELT